jgi:predicted lipid-binding transport protein (Tim44 family)
MPADLLLYGLIAAGLIFWLKSILGTRTDDDLERPSKFTFEEENINPDKNQKVNIDTLAGVAFILPRNVRIDNKTTENMLQDLTKSHPEFNFTHFAQNLEQAFTLIIEAFAEGDTDTLEALLTNDVYETFESEIKAREKRGEVVETEVKSVEKIDVTDVAIKDDHISITVRFTARELCVIRDKEGEIISGAEDKVTQMVDVWVFGKDIKDRGPEWYLEETRDEEVEDHKTPVPDAGEKGK